MEKGAKTFLHTFVFNSGPLESLPGSMSRKLKYGGEGGTNDKSLERSIGGVVNAEMMVSRATSQFSARLSRQTCNTRSLERGFGRLLGL